MLAPVAVALLAALTRAALGLALAARYGIVRLGETQQAERPRERGRQDPAARAGLGQGTSECIKACAIQGMVLQNRL